MSNSRCLPDAGSGAPSPGPSGSQGGSGAPAPVTRTGRRGEAVAIAAILMLALALRVIFTYQVHRSPITELAALRRGTDAVTYDNIARWILANNWYEKSVDVSPLYPHAFLPIAYRITGGNIMWAKFLQGLVDTATVLLIYLLARRLFGRRAAVYAGLIAAVYAPFIIYQGQILGESLLNFVVAALFLVLLGIEGRITWGRAAASGALLALAALAKPTAIVLLPLTLLLVWRRSGLSLRAARPLAAPLAVMFAAFVVVLAPFAFRNWRASGEFHLVRGNSGIMLYMGNNPTANGAFSYPSDAAGLRLDEVTKDMSLAAKDRVYQKAALNYIVSHPGHFLKLLGMKFRLFFGAQEVPNNISTTLYRQTTFLETWIFAGFGFVLPLAVTGFVMGLRARGTLFVAAQVAVYAAAIIVFIVVGRYRLMVLPLLIPAAGFALSEFVLAFKSFEMKRAAAVAFVFAAVAVPVNWAGISATVQQRLNPAGFRMRSGDVTVYYDDSAFATPFSAPLVLPASRATKFFVAGAPFKDVRAVSVSVQMATVVPGRVRVTLNDATVEQDMVRGPKRWVRFRFPPSALNAGAPGEPVTNAVSVSYAAARGSMRGMPMARVYADDVFNFGRSSYTVDGMSYMSDKLDQLSYAENPSLHMGGHEFRIRLEVTGG